MEHSKQNPRFIFVSIGETMTRLQHSYEANKFNSKPTPGPIRANKTIKHSSCLLSV